MLTFAYSYELESVLYLEYTDKGICILILFSLHLGLLCRVLDGCYNAVALTFPGEVLVNTDSSQIGYQC